MGSEMCIRDSKLADYIYIMNSGNIVAHGNRSEILKKGDLMSSLTGVEN